MASEDFELALESIRSGKGTLNGASPMEVIPSLLRGAFRAPEHFHFVASDYSQIELRVLAWLTGSRNMLQVFKSGLDPYIDFAMRMYEVPYGEVTKAQRQIAKPAVLSCGYGTGGGQEVEQENGDVIKTGLWGYAESMGVSMTQAEAHEAVDKYRRTYTDVPDFWYGVEDQIKNLFRNPEHRTLVWNLDFTRIVFHLLPGRLLRIVLPSGRSLHYLKPEFGKREVYNARTGTSRMESGVTYLAEIKPGVLKRRRLYGSLLTENLVQAIARDVMAVGMKRAHAAGFSIVGHTHDEIVTLERLDTHRNLTYLNNTMVSEIEWCKTLPLKSDGWEGQVYRK